MCERTAKLNSTNDMTLMREVLDRDQSAKINYNLPILEIANPPDTCTCNSLLIHVHVCPIHYNRDLLVPKFWQIIKLFSTNCLVIVHRV